MPFFDIIIRGLPKSENEKVMLLLVWTNDVIFWVRIVVEISVVVSFVGVDSSIVFIVFIPKLLILPVIYKLFVLTVSLTEKWLLTTVPENVGVDSVAYVFWISVLL